MKTLGKRHYFAFIMKMIYRHKNVGLRNYTFDSYFLIFKRDISILDFTKSILLLLKRI